MSYTLAEMTRLINPITWETECLGGMEISMWTWSSNRRPSMMLHSFCLDRFRRISPRSGRMSLKILFRRYFGIHTMWYLQSHRVWFNLDMVFIEGLLHLSSERFSDWRLSMKPVIVKLWGVPRQSRGFTRLLLLFGTTPGRNIGLTSSLSGHLKNCFVGLL